MTKLNKFTNEEYIQHLRAFKLASGRERQKIAQQLLESLEGLIVFLVNRRKGRPEYLREEAIAKAREILFTCCFDQWDEAKMAAAGGKFTNYAAIWIKAAIIKATREINTPMVLRPYGVMALKMFKQSHTPFSEEKSDEVIPYMEWLDSVRPGNKDEDYSVEEKLHWRGLMSNDTEVINNLHREKQAARIRDLAKKVLTPREYEIIWERMEDGKSLNEIGQRLGVSRERVRQLEAIAFRKLKLKLAANPDVFE